MASMGETGDVEVRANRRHMRVLRGDCAGPWPWWCDDGRFRRREPRNMSEYQKWQ
ncbi:MAG TPA: hypothetical protein DEF41_02475 [Desulfovibrio sp.]|uniref:Uncharacterized protein n=1 Tax=Nitratidesulfovibrio vulgaris (strain ATCC 29579 / DSM 644 / CCUG 34227 / NCIMB 8303 / VKM B-1760 / Hildenborough) TaxID=882 RepID=Q725Y5_NITV2|nr:hypothetical protein DVU_3289 [Nitratidesulfovibrio vulgaris str. Hildenborough]HBW15014.1 hypothetical protein [Desulfovibrio sp.]